MYTIGQVSAMFSLPVSTLRYYDKEGFFPNLERKGNIRYFSDNELEALRIIECLKKSGLEIKDIKQFFIWVSEGSSSYEKRKELFETRKSAVETEIQELQKTLSLLKFKCWYYETAMKDGNEDAINAMLPDKLPKICRNYMIKGMTDFCFLHQTGIYSAIFFHFLILVLKVPNGATVLTCMNLYTSHTAVLVASSAHFLICGLNNSSSLRESIIA